MFVFETTCKPIFFTCWLDCSNNLKCPIWLGTEVGIISKDSKLLELELAVPLIN